MAPRKKAAEDAAPEAENDVQMEDVSAADAEPEQQFEDHDPALLAFEEQRIRIVSLFFAPLGGIICFKDLRAGGSFFLFSE